MFKAGVVGVGCYFCLSRNHPFFWKHFLSFPSGGLLPHSLPCGLGGVDEASPWLGVRAGLEPRPWGRSGWACDPGWTNGSEGA